MELGQKLKMIDNSIKKKANSDLQEMDLTVAQHRTLVHLARREDGCAELKELEREFCVAQATMAGIAQRLEAKGYVCAFQSPTDKRVKLIRLTDTGRELTVRSFRKMQARMDRVLAALTPREVEELNRLLDKVNKTLQKDD